MALRCSLCIGPKRRSLSRQTQGIGTAVPLNGRAFERAHLLKLIHQNEHTGPFDIQLAPQMGLGNAGFEFYNREG